MATTVIANDRSESWGMVAFCLLERATLAVSAKQRGEMGRQYGVGTVRVKVISGGGDRERAPVCKYNI
jgi:hypothetical protein